ncbi:MAG: PDZ domain-containing protein, partial [Bacteroidota bacterium]
MPIQVAAVDPGSLADELGWGPGDQVLAVDGQSIEDELDFRFRTGGEEALTLKVRLDGTLDQQHVTKDPDEPFGATFEE